MVLFDLTAAGVLCSDAKVEFNFYDFWRSLND